MTTIWQKTASPILTWAFQIKYPSRKAIAASIRQQSKRLIEPMDKKNLIALMIKNKILQPKFKDLSPGKLEHYHFCKALTQNRVYSFILAFDKAFKGRFEINLTAGQFSIMPTVMAIPETADITQQKPGEILRPLILMLLSNANRALTRKQIRDTLKTKHNIAYTPEQIAFELGQLNSEKSILTVQTEDPTQARYLAAHRQKDMLADNLIYHFIDENGKEGLIHNGSAYDLANSNKALRILQADRKISYVSKEHLKIKNIETTQIKTSGKRKAYAVYTDNLNELVEQALLVRGLEEDTLATYYIDTIHQTDFSFEIFNVFALAFLGEKRVGGKAYKKLRAAFTAGINVARPKSITSFLYEARKVVYLGGQTEAVYLALLKDPKAARMLQGSSIFSPEEIGQLSNRLSRLNLLAKFPLFFMPGWSYSLQNYIHYIYDQTDTYEVFLCLLVRKTDQLRRCLKQNNLTASPHIIREIEMVFAPLAESKGFEDFGNDLRGLSAQLCDPSGYKTAQKLLEQALGTSRSQARRHLINLRRELGTEIIRKSYNYLSQENIRMQSRVKEVSSLKGKTDLKPYEIRDFLGIRIICKTLDEARVITSQLRSRDKSSRFCLAELPGNENPIDDNLEKPNDNGWRGWRGQFTDPDQKERTISIQVLTEEMEKADKQAAFAHWAYKAERAARITTKGLPHYRKQLFDPAPIYQYNRDPEHDFYVDRNYARKYNRVFVTLDTQRVKGLPSADEMGKVAIHRVKEGGLVEDIVAFPAYDKLLLADYAFCDIYYPKLNDKGEIEFVSFKKGPAKAAANEIVPNGTFIVINCNNGGVNRSVGTLAETKLRSKEIRTKLLCQLALSNETGSLDINNKIKEGKAKPVAKLLNTREKRQEIIRQAGLVYKDNSELWLAIAFDLITEERVRDWLGILEAIVSYKTSKKGDLEIEISAPDRQGLLDYILSELEDSYKILGARVKTNQQFLGASPAKITLTLKEKHKLETVPSPLVLQKTIDSIAFPKKQKNRPSTYAEIQLQNVRGADEWKTIHLIAKKAQELGISIVELNLPPAKGNDPGFIRLEKEGESGEDFEALFGELKEFAHVKCKLIS
ncbi:MAG: hypothetical protein KJ811_04260 [Candidatus Margulisbacteria bacterium]|nr:hypothetical protein [Candidatus Margulisiibacteriota bacterium]